MNKSKIKLLNRIQEQIKEDLKGYIGDPLTKEQIKNMKKCVEKQIYKYVDEIFDVLNVKEGGGYIPIVIFPKQSKKQIKNREFTVNVYLEKQQPFSD